MLPTVEDQFGSGNTSWKLQEDNDPKHRSKLAIEWKSQHNIDVIEWQSASHELAHMENVWHILKMNIRKKKYQNIQILSFKYTKRMEEVAK